ncbi:glycoside hydrolase family 5 protein [Desarmillaria tabescens]|uniref:Glycoside hydrolase family 5 protein n=1 Tax=Armillaria tabescens TaxID=1929756 RepID=A0AA39N4M1_ARMTA|nr:glycoside hydrolase family 5 protein [Desarmillaria tabescens]KAK0457249.1 glycoside hydrolase family 5 protein [Desarmillaria tabescens]
MPDKVYGVSLGSWLILESWMLPEGIFEWIRMGGELCDDRTQCISAEFELARAYPDTVDEVFDTHWSSRFNQDDVRDLVEVGINTVRIPLGYWIIEALVDRKTEFYPRGGIHHLKRGLRQLKDAGIMSILDHHGLPGVQSPNHTFTGRCTSDAEFFTEYNYHRALVWTAVITTLSHLDPDFSNVVSIEAVNEPTRDATQTPGYGGFQKNFVQVVRAVELTLGINVPWSEPNITTTDTSNFTVALENTASSSSLDSEVRSVLSDAVPILVELTYNNPSNPRDAQIGPQFYDDHLYYLYGGTDVQASMESICNLPFLEDDAALGNNPVVFGEWSLSTQFTATDEFLYKFADAQKLAFTKGAGWIFWSFKVEISTLAGDLARQWSYLEGVKRGYFTRDPSKVNDTHVCDSYV